MSDVMEEPSPQSPADTDLATAAQRVLAASPEPLTLSKMRAKLPAPHRQLGLEELAEALNRQVSANVLYQYPKYRSPQDRYWDRPMSVHIAALLRETLEEKPLALAQLKRKLPPYAVAQVQEVLEAEVARGGLYRHPPAGSRGGDRFGARPPDAKEYLRQEMPGVFTKLEQLGFTREQIRGAAIELLHEEEWPQGTITPDTQSTGPADGSGRQPAGELTPGPDATSGPPATEAWGHETLP